MPPMLDGQRDELARHNPGWEVWYVQRMVLGIVWCARCAGAALTDTVYADTPEHLQDEINEARNGGPNIGNR